MVSRPNLAVSSTDHDVALSVNKMCINFKSSSRPIIYKQRIVTYLYIIYIAVMWVLHQWMLWLHIYIHTYIIHTYTHTHTHTHIHTHTHTHTHTNILTWQTKQFLKTSLALAIGWDAWFQKLLHFYLKFQIFLQRIPHRKVCVAMYMWLYGYNNILEDN